jgi:aspartate carbamoyltransferase catalytic subunit
VCLPRAWHRLTTAYLKSRNYRLFLQTQRDFASKSLGIHKGFRRLFALHPACFCEISVIFFVFRYTIRKGWLLMRHLIDPLDFTKEETQKLLDLADRIHDDPEAYQDVADRKRLATLFYEPSTRTRLSFESAMLRLGGKVLGFPDAGVSSASKGETVADTIRIISCYADIAAMRHPKEGAPLRASLYSKIPVINAGDGGHSHPTQTLLDMMTIRRRKGRLDNLTIGFCGDLKFGRTVHSLIKSLARYDNVKFVLISPEELRVPDYIINEVLEPRGIPYIETRNLEGALPDLDILYMTRVQRERFFNEEDYIRLRDSYILTAEKLNLAPADMAVLHPLPRVNEITLDVDDDPRAAYFEQAQNGVYVRMALIMTLLGLKDPKTGEVAFEC